MMDREIVDLHVHSTMSDGTDRPEEIVRKAEAAGIWGVALTDHDSVRGVPAALKAVSDSGFELRFLSGIEIGTEDKYGNLHILGYFRDPDLKRFDGELEWIRKARTERNRAILECLGDLDMPVTMEELEGCAGDDVIGRLHIARLMYAKGYISTLKEGFVEYLNDGAECFVRRKTFSSVEAIELIKEYGGVVSMAHPFLIPDQRMELGRIVSGLIEDGMDGIEVYYVEHTAEQTAYLKKLCDSRGLLKTGGTDYHGKNKPGVRLGVGRGEMRIPRALMEGLIEELE